MPYQYYEAMYRGPFRDHGVDREEEEEEGWYEEQMRMAVNPQYQIKLRIAACMGGNRESRIVGLVSLLEYILTVPEFVKEHQLFRETACAKAREFLEEPALTDVCQRVLDAYARPRG
jgi:hypothetical protein